MATRVPLKKPPEFMTGILAGALGMLVFLLSVSCLYTGCLRGVFCSSPDAKVPAAASLQLGQTVDRRATLEERTESLRRLEDAVRANVAPEIRERCLAVIRGQPGSLYGGWSQAGQDWLLFHNYFVHIPYGQGTYIDIGANHPEELSNTFFFDRCLGWRGVCVEPNPEYHPLYAKHGRTCKLQKNCLSDSPGKVTFEWGGVLGRITANPQPSTGGNKETWEAHCLRLTDILAENSLEHVDLATIDIEGAEYMALRCFPFGAYKIDTWLAEIDKSPELAELFIRGGYAHVLDIICPVEMVYSNTTRVGWALDSVFRRQTPLFYGPPFLPGKHFEGSLPKGPCQSGQFDEAHCPEQVPVIDRREVNYKSHEYTLKKGVCSNPWEGSSSAAAYDHILAKHPAIANPPGMKS